MSSQVIKPGQTITFPISGSGGTGGASSVGATWGGPDPSTSQGLSYIDDDEIKLAKELIDKQFTDITGKQFGFRAAGYYLACKIYIRPEEMKVIKKDDGTEVTLWHAPHARDNEKFHSVAALVCGIGPQAFTGYDIHGHKRFPSGPACRVGDWIAIPRSQAFVLSYRTVAMALIPDDMVLGVIEDPTDVTPITQAALV